MSRFVATPDRTRHVLSNSDRDLVRRTASSRMRTNRSADVRNLRIGSQSDLDTEIVGLGGEVAFCRYFGLDPDTTDAAAGVVDGERLVDAVLPDGRTVDVKTSSHPRANLVARKIHDDVDVFVLVRGRFPAFELVGWIDRETFARAKKKNLGYGETHFYDAKNLHPISTLLNP